MEMNGFRKISFSRNIKSRFAVSHDSAVSAIKVTVRQTLPFNGKTNLANWAE
jgi:hypothetical protein